MTTLASTQQSPAALRRSRPQAWRAAATATVWLTSLATLALWVGGGGLQAIAALTPESLASVARIAGLVSANLLLLQVLLMARVPLFERGFGRSGITRMHRLTGIWSVSLLAVHIVLIVAAYALQDGVNLIAEAWDVIWGSPGVFAASLGVIALIGVMASSARRARQRLRYETWHLLHLYAYFGVAISVPHMLLTGHEFVGNPVASWYWWTLWAVAAGCVLVFRVAVPLWRSARSRIRVAEVVSEGSRGVTVRLHGRGLHRLGARAGQHFVWRFLDGPGWSRGHPFSLSAAPTADRLQLSARVVGDGTRRLADLAPGTPVMIEGPYGSMTGAARTQPGLLMIGAGAGVAPLVAILEDEPFAPGEAVLVTRERAAEETMLGESIRRLITDRGLVHYTLLGPRAQGGPSWLPAQYAHHDGAALLQSLAPGGADGLARCDVYLCGPPAWMTAVQHDLLAAGVAPAHLHTEHFTQERSTGGAS